MGGGSRVKIPDSLLDHIFHDCMSFEVPIVTELKPKLYTRVIKSFGIISLQKNELILRSMSPL